MTTARVAATIETRRRSSPRAWGYLKTNPSFWVGLIGVILIVGSAIFAPLIAPHDPNLQFRGEGLTKSGDPLGPTAKFPLGTDKLGRDELSRLLYGARTSLTVGIVANSLAVFIGVLVGTTAAYFRGRPAKLQAFGRGPTVSIPVESILMRTTDAFLAFPALLVAIALVAIVGPSLGLVIVVIAAILWTATCRITYSTSLVVLAILRERGSSPTG